MNAFDDNDQFRLGLAKLNAIYAHEYTQGHRRGKTPVVFEDEPVAPSVVELFERMKKGKPS